MTDKLKNKFPICENCNEKFVFNVEAQQYFINRGYHDDPRRCKACQIAFKKRQRNNDHRPGTSPSQ